MKSAAFCRSLSSGSTASSGSSASSIGGDESGCNNLNTNSNETSRVRPNVQPNKVNREPPRGFYSIVNTYSEDLLNGSIFTVSGCIGSGYSGSVYKCIFHNRSQGRTRDCVVAIKVMNKEKTKTKSALNEVTLLKAATGPNVLKFFDSMETLDSYWIVTEFCQGGDLHGKLQVLDSENIMARSYMRDVVNGLLSLHNKCIVHADIKMKNILINDRNVAKIGDFGFAKQYNSLYDRETLCQGTKDYWSPEMLQGGPNYDPFKADIYALGVTFVGVLARRPIKMKYDNIHHVVNKFRDLNQVALFKGILNTAGARSSLLRIKSNSWLSETQSRLS